MHVNTQLGESACERLPVALVSLAPRVEDKCHHMPPREFGEKSSEARLPRPFFIGPTLAVGDDND